MPSLLKTAKTVSYIYILIRIIILRSFYSSSKLYTKSKLVIEIRLFLSTQKTTCHFIILNTIIILWENILYFSSSIYINAIIYNTSKNILKRFIRIIFSFSRVQLCEPIKMLPKCRYFRDMAWTLRSEGNGTLQTVHCHCPKGSVAYLLKRQAYQTETKEIGYQYSFACSPQSVSSILSVVLWYYTYKKVIASLRTEQNKLNWFKIDILICSSNTRRDHIDYRVVQWQWFQRPGRRGRYILSYSKTS